MRGWNERLYLKVHLSARRSSHQLRPCLQAAADGTILFALGKSLAISLMQIIMRGLHMIR
jgi:hypothetical protein